MIELLWNVCQGNQQPLPGSPTRCFNSHPGSGAGTARANYSAGCYTICTPTGHLCTSSGGSGASCVCILYTRCVWDQPKLAWTDTTARASVRAVQCPGGPAQQRADYPADADQAQDSSNRVQGL